MNLSFFRNVLLYPKQQHTVLIDTNCCMYYFTLVHSDSHTGIIMHILGSLTLKTKIKLYIYSEGNPPQGRDLQDPIGIVDHLNRRKLTEKYTTVALNTDLKTALSELETDYVLVILTSLLVSSGDDDLLKVFSAFKSVTFLPIGNNRSLRRYVAELRMKSFHVESITDYYPVLAVKWALAGRYGYYQKNPITEKFLEQKNNSEFTKSFEDYLLEEKFPVYSESMARTPNKYVSYDDDDYHDNHYSKKKKKKKYPSEDVGDSSDVVPHCKYCPYRSEMLDSDSKWFSEIKRDISAIRDSETKYVGMLYHLNRSYGDEIRKLSTEY